MTAFQSDAFQNSAFQSFTPDEESSCRASMVNISCPWRGILPFPDASISQADRQGVAFMYSCILAGEAVVVEEPRRGGAWYPSPEELRELQQSLARQQRKEREESDKFTSEIGDLYDRIHGVKTGKRLGVTSPATIGPPPNPRQHIEDANRAFLTLFFSQYEDDD